MRFLRGRLGLKCLLHFSLTLNFFFSVLIFKPFSSTPKTCSTRQTDIHDINGYHSLSIPTIYIITATYPRLVQFAELTRLCHTLLLVKNVHWIVIEDTSFPSADLEIFLRKCNVSFTLLSEKTPPDQILPPGQPRWLYPRGVVQRNRGLQWLRDNLKIGVNRGVVYIADDDNTYSLRLFDEIRTTERVSTWPVALAGRLKWEGCITKPDLTDVIDRMQTIFKPWREFPIDMAGFAVNLDLILSHPSTKFVANPKFYGMLETNFLKNLGLRNFSELEPKADGCKRILVWHTQTKDPDIVSLDKAKTSIQPEMLPCDP